MPSKKGRNRSGSQQAAAAAAAQSPTFAEALQDVELRFLLGLPEEETRKPMRMFSHIEQAWWFYEDFYADKYAHLPHMKMVEFAKRLFRACDSLQEHCTKPGGFEDAEVETMHKAFKAYQYAVPCCGCILLNESLDKFVMVESYNGNSWTFPRGKINQGESELTCARREAAEEIGYDVGTAIETTHDNRITATNGGKGGKKLTMFIVPGVPESTVFETRTRKEISDIQWFAVDEDHKRTYDVYSFLPRVRKWISKHGQKYRRKAARDKKARAQAQAQAQAQAAPASASTSTAAAGGAVASASSTTGMAPSVSAFFASAGAAASTDAGGTKAHAQAAVSTPLTASAKKKKKKAKAGGKPQAFEFDVPKLMELLVPPI